VGVRHLNLGLLIWVILGSLAAHADQGPARATAFVHVNVVLADMHTHSETRNDLAIYLATGVTTILQMGDARAGFVDTIVPAVNRGAIPGPHTYVGFLVDGSTDYNGFVIKTPAEARAIVGLAKTNGYDFIKVYVGLSPEVFSALADEGRRMSMPLIGHGVTAVRLERQLAQGQVLVKAMADAGVELVAGTDAPAVPGMLPGFSLHDDLGELEASGLTRFQALSTATRAPGNFIHRTKGGDLFGVVAPGYRADLILSEINPLATLATLRTPIGVMDQGQWRDAAALKALTDKVRESYRRAAEVPPE
jgi:hypothetical protein